MTASLPPPVDPFSAIGRVGGRFLTWILAAAFLVILAAVALAVPAGVAYAIYKAFPEKRIEPRTGAGWLDTIFSNQYVVFSARVVLIALALVLLFGATYISVSIFYRIYRREFLHKAGWFEAAVAATADRELEQMRSTYGEMLNAAWEQNEYTANRVEAALQALEETTNERDELQEEVDRLRGGTSPAGS